MLFVLLSPFVVTLTWLVLLVVYYYPFSAGLMAWACSEKTFMNISDRRQNNFKLLRFATSTTLWCLCRLVIKEIRYRGRAVIIIYGPSGGSIIIIIIKFVQVLSFSHTSMHQGETFALLICMYVDNLIKEIIVKFIIKRFTGTRID